MTDTGTKKCPFCAETIRADAILCRYCGSRLDIPRGTPSPSGSHWLRVDDGKRIAGVCTGIAREFNAPQLVLPLRVFFIFATFLSGFGAILYILLWMLMPPSRPATPRKSSTTIPRQPDEHGDLGGDHAAGNPHGHEGTVIALIGLVLVIAGLAAVMGLFGTGKLFHQIVSPFHNLVLTPHVQLLSVPIAIFARFWVIILLAGLFVMMFGALRLFRVMLGCGMMLFGTVFLLIFVPFVPTIFLVGSVVLLGFVLLIGGIFKILLGI